MVTHVGTVAVYVTDQKQALSFWMKQVGFVIHREHAMGPDARWIEVGPSGAKSALVLYPRAMMADWAERKPSIVFECDDVQRTYEEMQERGVRFPQPPKEMAWGRFALFEDPDGNSFGLRSAQEPSA